LALKEFDGDAELDGGLKNGLLLVWGERQTKRGQVRSDRRETADGRKKPRRESFETMAMV